MQDIDIETIVQRGREKHPGPRPRVMKDHDACGQAEIALCLARTEGRRRSGKTKTSASRGDTKRCMSVRNRLD
jgi:hypothetical protein